MKRSSIIAHDTLLTDEQRQLVPSERDRLLLFILDSLCVSGYGQLQSLGGIAPISRPPHVQVFGPHLFWRRGEDGGEGHIAGLFAELVFTPEDHTWFSVRVVEAFRGAGGVIGVGLRGRGDAGQHLAADKSQVQV
jgi:hypothetical protein